MSLETDLTLYHLYRTAAKNAPVGQEAAAALSAARTAMGAGFRFRVLRNSDQSVRLDLLFAGQLPIVGNRIVVTQAQLAATTTKLDTSTSAGGLTGQIESLDGARRIRGTAGRAGAQFVFSDDIRADTPIGTISLQIDAPTSMTSGGGVELIASSDSRVITWVTPDTPIASAVTDGRYQIDRQGDFRSMPTDAAGSTGATHSAEGVAWPAGGSGDAGFAFRRTAVLGKKRFHHQVGSALSVNIGGVTWRSEHMMFSGRIDRGQEFLLSMLIRLDASMMVAGAPFVSFGDMHHEQWEDGNPYGGPGPFGVWGDRSGIYVYHRLGVGGVWTSGPVIMHSWTPQVDRDYWLIFNGRQHHQAGQGAFLNVWRAVDDGPVVASDTYSGPWGVDNATNATSTMYFKNGLYAFSAPGVGPFSRKSAGIIALRGGGTPAITVERLLATHRAVTA